MMWLKWRRREKGSHTERREITLLRAFKQVVHVHQYSRCYENFSSSQHREKFMVYLEKPSKTF